MSGPNLTPAPRQQQECEGGKIAELRTYLTYSYPSRGQSKMIRNNLAGEGVPIFSITPLGA